MQQVKLSVLVLAVLCASVVATQAQIPRIPSIPSIPRVPSQLQPQIPRIQRNQQAQQKEQVAEDGIMMNPLKVNNLQERIADETHKYDNGVVTGDMTVTITHKPKPEYYMTGERSPSPPPKPGGGNRIGSP